MTHQYEYNKQERKKEYQRCYKRGNDMNNNVVKNVNGQVGEGVGFERIRRITGYLVGTLDRFNNGKRAEVEDRVKHGLN